MTTVTTETAAAGSEPVFELEDVDVPAIGLPDSCLVSGVSWRVETGQRWVVTGPSGSGKSSLLQVAAGLLRPTRGRHRLFGADLTAMGEREQVVQRIRVGMVFGGNGRLFEHLTVAENVALPLSYHAREREAVRIGRVAELLEALGLESIARRYPRELARRWTQRVALARALALGPEALLLDDPGSGLGPTDAEWWRGFVRNSVAGGIASCRELRTVVVAVPEIAGWAGLFDGRADVEGGQWRAERS